MALRRIIINKVNPISPGFDLTALLPRSTLDRGPSPLVRISLASYLGVSSRCVGSELSLRLRPLFDFVPSIAVPSFTAVQVVLDQSIYRPLVPLSLSPSPMMRRTHSTMLPRLVRVRH